MPARASRSSRPRTCRVAALVLLLVSCNARAETLSLVAHIHTPLSGGEYTPDEIAGILASQGIDAGIVTDHDRLEIEWGLPLLRNLLQYTYRRTSIATDGFDRYVRSIREAGARFPGLILLPGVEANPYYRVEADWRSLRFRVYDIHEHILALGLAGEELATLPAIANGFRPSLPRRLGAALGALVLVAGFVLMLGRSPRTEGRLRSLRVRSRTVPPIAAGAAALAALAGIDALALLAKPVHQYAPDAGALPYQIFIDWVRDRGGLTFWAHPTMDEVIRIGPFEAVTRPYVSDLADTDRYDGLGGFGREIVAAGGLWDRLLVEAVGDRRQTPPWFLAQADFKSGRPERLASAVNYVDVRERSAEGLLEALRRGRFHATRGSFGKRWRLVDFRVSDGEREARSGETLATKRPVVVSASFQRISPRARPLFVQLIADGNVLSRSEVAESVELRFEDPRSGPRYLRLSAGSRGRVELVTNPVFVR